MPERPVAPVKLALLKCLPLVLLVQHVLALPSLPSHMQLGADTVYAVDSSQSFYGWLDTAGITVRTGASGTIDYTIDYEIKMKGVDSRTVASDDSSFVSTLSTEEKAKYSKAKQSYSGGLNIPMLTWIGIDLNAKVDKEDMSSAASSNTRTTTSRRRR